jgi:hypothetical protein
VRYARYGKPKPLPYWTHVSDERGEYDIRVSQEVSPFHLELTNGISILPCNHTTRCCLTHAHHLTPHRGCILR